VLVSAPAANGGRLRWGRLRSGTATGSVPPCWSARSWRAANAITASSCAGWRSAARLWSAARRPSATCCPAGPCVPPCSRWSSRNSSWPRRRTSCVRHWRHCGSWWSGAGSTDEALRLVDRLSRLVTGLLARARMEAGAQRAELVPLRLDQLVETTIEELPDHEHVTVRSEPVVVLGDPTCWPRRCGTWWRTPSDTVVRPGRRWRSPSHQAWSRSATTGRAYRRRTGSGSSPGVSPGWGVPERPRERAAWGTGAASATGSCLGNWKPPQDRKQPRDGIAAGTGTASETGGPPRDQEPPREQEPRPVPVPGSPSSDGSPSCTTAAPGSWTLPAAA
jgi:hypothetical protein